MISGIPNNATHKRDDGFYKVTNKVQYFNFESEEWTDCHDCFDLSGWHDELEPLTEVN